MIAADAIEQNVDGKRAPTDLDDAGVETGNIEQRTEQSPHRVGGGLDLFEQTLSFRRQVHAAQRADEQAKGMDRLPQIMARRGQEGRLGKVSLLGDLLLSLQIRRQILGPDAQLGNLLE